MSVRIVSRHEKWRIGLDRRHGQYWWPVHKNKDLGKRARGHALHLPFTELARAARVQRLVDVPQREADTQEEEEAGEEDGKEDKEINVRLVLTKEKVTLSAVRCAAHNNVETRGFQLMLVARESDN